MNTAEKRRRSAWHRYLRFWGGHPERDLDDELAFHLSARYDEFVAAGLTPEQARAEAARRFGDLGRVREHCTIIDQQWERERSMKEMGHQIRADLRYAVRQLRHDASLSVAAILCLALGIGANSSIFSVVNGVLFRPLPFEDPGKLVLVGDWLPQIGPENFGVISPAEFTDYSRLDGRIFSNSATYDNSSAGGRGVALFGAGLTEPERVSSVNVSPSLFPTLGVRAAMGRTFGATDDTVGGSNVIILSDAIWRTRFGGRDVVGASIDVDGRPRTIVGVMPRSFRFPIAGAGGEPADVFLPRRITAEIENERGQSYEAYFIGRLATGVTMAHARSAVANVAASFPKLYPRIFRSGWVEKADIFPFRDRAVRDIRRPLLILLGAVALVLLIACLNVSSLLLARAAARQREIAVRQALGASRMRLVRQFLAESLTLAVAGGGLGLAIAFWASRVMARVAPADLLQGYDASVDGRVLATTACVVLLTAIAFSIVPALGQRDGRLGAALRSEGRASTAGTCRARGRRFLVAGQIATALILSAAAGLMIRSFVAASEVNPGFEAQHLVSFRVALPEAKYATPASVLAFDRQLQESLQRLPGVTTASGTLRLPMQEPMQMLFSVEGQAPAEAPIGTGTFVLPDYFATMRIPVLSGQPIDASNTIGSNPVVMVNAALARRFYGDDGVRTAVGKRIKWGTAQNAAPWLTIIGVAADVKDAGLDKKQEWSIYFPALQAADVNLNGMMRSFAFVARSNGDDGAVLREVRRAVRGIDPTMPIVGPNRMTELVSTSLGDRRFNTYAIGAFALLALVLASVGIYGLVAYLVVQRSREIGLRLALGAVPRDVLRLVLGQGAALGAIGILAGLIGTVAAARTFQSMLFGVGPFDAISFAAAATILFAVTMAASMIPAWRASKLDPQATLRE